MLGSNNYLGLTNHPWVKEAVISAVKKYGTGCTGSRYLNGTLSLHEDRNTPREVHATRRRINV